MYIYIYTHWNCSPFPVTTVGHRASPRPSSTPERSHAAHATADRAGGSGAGDARRFRSVFFGAEKGWDFTIFFKKI